VSPTKILPPKIGINGFNGIGRLILRAALEAGLEVKAVNEPFVPLHYMVYMLKFDIAHSSSQYHGKEFNVREGPTGQLVVNGKVIHVFMEHDVSKIPWELASVNYVVEATEALNTKAEASLHIQKANRGVRMKHLLEMQNENPDLLNGDSDALGMLHAGCKRVVIAGPSPDAPLKVVGINADDLDPEVLVLSHASAPASALTPVLSVIHKKFGIKSCAYTLLKAIRGHSKDSMKCTNAGPTSHARSVTWDFSENLVPTQMLSLEEETLRILPFLHKKLKGMCVYVPTPEVSMFDLTLQLEQESGDNLYRDVCVALKEAASEAPLKTVMRYCMKMSNDNSASSLFASETHSCIIDAKSGCQVTSDTIKLVVWFDNECGHAYRIIDLITNCHVAYK
jgi:glyceraldehyde 3-phosphate dehydrogenase